MLLRLATSVRPAGITLIALGTVAALAFLYDDFDSPSILLLLLTVAFGAQWLLGPARGASPLLTLALLSAWGLVLDVVSSDGSSSDAAISLSDVAVPDSAFTNGDDTVSYFSLIIGIALLLATRSLDHRGFQGMATSALIVGDIAFVVGVFGVVATFEEDAIGSSIVIVAGLVLAYVGAGGGRRFTTWLGGIGFLVGLLALLISGLGSTDAVQFGATAIVTGVVIVIAAAFVNPGPAETTPSLDPPARVDQPEGVGQGWHADPSGRHQLRWHNGIAWTPHVSDQGQASTDEGL